MLRNCAFKWWICKKNRKKNHIKMQPTLMAYTQQQWQPFCHARLFVYFYCLFFHSLYIKHKPRINETRCRHRWTKCKQYNGWYGIKTAANNNNITSWCYRNTFTMVRLIKYDCAMHDFFFSCVFLIVFFTMPLMMTMINFIRARLWQETRQFEPKASN